MCTGNIKSINSDKYSDAVYPCMYREHSSVMSNGKRKYGLSLYVQGTLFIKSLNPIFSRFIPVYTGNAFPQLQSPEFYPVYPCVYRERIFCSIFTAARRGLSLCIQGTLFNIKVDKNMFPVYPCVYRERTNYNILFYI